MFKGIESINDLEDYMVLGYFESIKGVFYAKMGVAGWFELGNVAQHRELSSAASKMAKEFGDEDSALALSHLQPEMVENLKEDAITAAVLSAWAVFEQIIKDLPNPDYADTGTMFNADFYRNIFGFTNQEKKELEFFYHLRNAIVHYNGAYHAYRQVDLTYEGEHFKSAGHFGEKMIVSPKIAHKIVCDLEKYAIKAWSNSAAQSGRA